MRLEREPDAAAAVAYLDAHREQLDAILCWETGYDAGWVLQEVLHGRLWLYRCIEEGEPVGFLLAMVDRRRPSFPVFYAWGLAVASAKPWHASVARAIQEVATDAGCFEVRARSPRPGWARWARKLGWRQGATEYVKEV
jgi:hypothetical protein